MTVGRFEPLGGLMNEPAQHVHPCVGSPAPQVGGLVPVRVSGFPAPSHGLVKRQNRVLVPLRNVSSLLTSGRQRVPSCERSSCGVTIVALPDGVRNGLASQRVSAPRWQPNPVHHQHKINRLGRSGLIRELASDHKMWPHNAGLLWCQPTRRLEERQLDRRVPVDHATAKNINRAPLIQLLCKALHET